YQELIIDILETTAGMVEKGTLYPTKDLPSSDELIRRIKVLLSEYPAQEEHTEQIARKVLLERLSREIVGIYYAVKRIIPPLRDSILFFETVSTVLFPSSSFCCLTKVINADLSLSATGSAGGKS